MTRLKRRRRLRNSLTNKQKLFVSYYMVHLNGKKAAIDAGYSRKTSGAQGSRLLSNVNIRRLIDKRIQNRTKQINLTTNKVLRDIEFTRLRALESRHFGTAAKCSELMGKHLGMFRDNILIENEIHLDMKRKEMELIDKLKKLGGIDNGITKIKPAEIEYQPQ